MPESGRESVPPALDRRARQGTPPELVEVELDRLGRGVIPMRKQNLRRGGSLVAVATLSTAFMGGVPMGKLLSPLRSDQLWTYCIQYSFKSQP